MKIIFIVLVLMLTGCGGKVNGWEFNGAYEFCKDKGGVDIVYINIFDTKVWCVDGSNEFTYNIAN